jgi:hypothetical protein
MKAKLEELDNMKFISLYTNSSSILKPDYTYSSFEESNPPVFFWENKNK